jgi:signal transduction histidine kinase
MTLQQQLDEMRARLASVESSKADTECLIERIREIIADLERQIAGGNDETQVQTT